MRVVVTGSRDCTDERGVMEALSTFHRDRGPITRLAHGAYRGVDTFAKRWAQETRGVFEVGYPAKWREFGPAAGPRRNSEMLKSELPDVVLAFPGGRGTADCVAKAQSMEIEIVHLPLP